MIQQKESSSFRDPSSQVYVTDSGIYRVLSRDYLPHYRQLMDSGLYSKLVENELLITHSEAKDCLNPTIVPQTIPFLSYPYEWCFSQLKQAALATLAINNIAMELGMMLKDASAFNIQYHKGKFKLIDTTSFVKYEPGMPWMAYRQFIQHFLAPLVLMKYVDSSLIELLKSNIDGIQPKLAIKILSWRFFRFIFKPSIFLHLYLQSANRIMTQNRSVKMSGMAMKSLLDSLQRLIESLDYKIKSNWSKYADNDSYTALGKASKRTILAQMLNDCTGTLLDIGCNDGKYSLIAHALNYQVIATDRDHDCIETLYRSQPHLLSLVIDICNPSPAIGWGNTERKSFLERTHADVIMALALIHHLCIGNNVPLVKVADLLAEHCKRLIIEFVPLEDPKAKLLLGNKVIPPYSYGIFQSAFSDYFTIDREVRIEDSQRIMFLMEKR